MAPITETPEWRALDAHFEEMRDVHLRDLFADDPAARRALTVEVDGIYLDYSKHRITAETIAPPRRAGASGRGLRDRIDAMFRGEKINVTEDRAVLHVALRAPEGAVIEVDGENVVPAVHAVLRKMADFSERVRSGAVDRPHRQARPQRRQHRHRRLRPRPAHGVRRARATTRQRDMTFRFVSNVDGTDFWEATHDLDPAETLFVDLVEDLHHARDAHQRAQRARVEPGRSRRRRVRRRQALRRGVDQRGRGGEVRDRHRQHVRVLGLGRRPLLVRLRHRAVADGRDRPRAVHARCSPASARIDEHFRTAPFEPNLPVLLGLIGIWYDDFFGAETQAILPVQPVPGALPRVPPAARHGERRQVGRPRRQPGHACRPARSCGASPAPTASTRSTN